jgi:hypothetical protein
VTWDASPARIHERGSWPERCVDLATGQEDAERVMVAFLLAPAALEQGKSVANVKIAGATPMWQWAGDDTTVFS